MKLEKQHFPLIYLVLISISWSYVYVSSSWINDYGQSKSEWLLLFDGLIVLPLVCLYCLKNKKEALIKAIAYGCLIILLGSYIIPSENKHLWTSFELGRYIVIGCFVLLEIISLLTLFGAIKIAFQSKVDPDNAIESSIFMRMGRNVFSNLLVFDVRMWSYIFFHKKLKTLNFEGTEHFYCHLKDGAQSNQLGFIILILIEVPIAHLLLHFSLSSYAANLITLLTLFGLLFFLAEYRALGIRPCSIDNEKVIIRYGLWNTLRIKYENINSIKNNRSYIKRESSIKRFNLSGNPNVKISLKTGSIKCIYLGLNESNKFVSEVNKNILG